MTCIIGMYYGSDKGALLMADSRTMMGGDYSRDRKVFEVAGDGIVFAATGYTGMVEKLLPKVASTRVRSRQFLPSEVVDIFEDEMADLYQRYKMTRPYRFSPDDTLLIGIIGLLEDDKPKLHCLHENGYAEAVHQFRVIGHGARHAHNILRTLYDPSISKARALEIGVHALLEVSKVDAMVDAYPQVAILEKGAGKSGLLILNAAAGKAGEFGFECEEIEKIKAKLAGIEEKRTKVFHLLLDGSDETAAKVDTILEEYEHARTGQEGGGGAEEGASTTENRGD